MNSPKVTESGNFTRHLLIGFVVAALGFALAFAALAKFLPLYHRFVSSENVKLLFPILIFFISLGWLLVCLGWLRRFRKRRVQEVSPRRTTP
jgi:uncharacterized membrane protein YidH (DUF202 family)